MKNIETNRIRVLVITPALLLAGVWLACGQPKGETATVKGEVVGVSFP